VAFGFGAGALGFGAAAFGFDAGAFGFGAAVAGAIGFFTGAVALRGAAVERETTFTLAVVTGRAAAGCGVVLGSGVTDATASRIAAVVGCGVAFGCGAADATAGPDLAAIRSRAGEPPGGTPPEVLTDAAPTGETDLASGAETAPDVSAARLASIERPVTAGARSVDPATIVVERNAAPMRPPTIQPGAARMPQARRATRCAWRNGGSPGARRRRGS